jgi:hypothetical protein
MDISVVLKDRGYCKWLLKQDWFQSSYEYLYNIVFEYDPKPFFITLPPTEFEGDTEPGDFIDRYQYFHLTPISELKINLTDEEKTCYAYYLRMINEIKEKINPLRSNPYNIKAPVRWLKRFENQTGLKRSVFKDCLSAYELKNVPYIVEDVKKVGGIEYKGAKSYLIAKERSLKQEQFWEKLLREKYGEDLGVQFKYEGCIFDFLHIPTNTIYEAKLGLKDFNKEQHRKYVLTLNKYKIVYLIGYDCVVNMEKEIIYTLNPDKYLTHQAGVPYSNSSTDFDYIIQNYNTIRVSNLEEIV